MPAPAPAAAVPTAGCVLVGDELLSGKIRDENGHQLAVALRGRGIALRELRMVSDAPADIVAALRALAPAVDVLFTSGGVGPTHDDRTLEAVALAFDRPLQPHALMMALVEQVFGPNAPDAARRMAHLPEGMTLGEVTQGERVVWPAMRLDVPFGDHTTRLYVLPGVPGLFRAKLGELLRDPAALPTGEPWHLRELHTTLDESVIASDMAAVAAADPDVAIGSYPSWTRDEQGRLHHRLRLTLEAPRPLAERVDAAADALQRVLDDATLRAARR